MFDSEMVFPVICQALVESTVFISCDVLRITSPNRLGLVELLVRGLLLLDLLGLLLLGFVVLVVNLFDLGLLTLLDFLLSVLILNFLWDIQ
jgi:hypothetical protein